MIDMRILIVKMSSLGDIIHAFPVLDYLKQIYPHARIDWVVEQPFAELVQAHPLVNQVFKTQTKKWRSRLLAKSTWQEIAQFRRELRNSPYELVLDLQGNSKSALATAFAKSPLKVGFAYSSVPEWPNLLATHQRYNPPQGRNIREDYLFLAQSAVGHFASVVNAGVHLKLSDQEHAALDSILERLQRIRGLKVMVCPGSNWANKQLSDETLKTFLLCFTRQLDAHFVFIWGNKSEKNAADEIASDFPERSSVMDRLSLPALQNLMAHVDLVLAMDSLPLHLAGTTLTPTYSFFGASSAHKYRPIGLQHEAYQGSCPYGQTFVKRCAILRTCKTGGCIKQLEGVRLFNHFFHWWSSLPHKIHSSV